MRRAARVDNFVFFVAFLSNSQAQHSGEESTKGFIRATSEGSATGGDERERERQMHRRDGNLGRYMLGTDPGDTIVSAIAEG